MHPLYSRLYSAFDWNIWLASCEFTCAIINKHSHGNVQKTTKTTTTKKCRAHSRNILSFTYKHTHSHKCSATIAFTTTVLSLVLTKYFSPLDLDNNSNLARNQITSLNLLSITKEHSHAAVNSRSFVIIPQNRIRA